MLQKNLIKILLVVLTQMLWGSLTCYSQTPPSQTLQSQTVLRLASDEWCPYVCVENGHISGGYLVEAVEQAMQLSGYRIEPVLVPFSRAISETRSGYIQGVFSPPLDQRLKNGNPVLYARSCFYTLKALHWTYQGISSLGAVKIGIIPDYNYDDGIFDAYLEKNRQNKLLIDMAYGEFAGNGNLKKLLAARFDVMVEDEAVMGLMVRKMQLGDQIRLAGCLENPIAVTIGFSVADSHSEAWVRALNAGMLQLEQSGKLQSLRRRYQIPANH